MSGDSRQCSRNPATRLIKTQNGIGQRVPITVFLKSRKGTGLKSVIGLVKRKQSHRSEAELSTEVWGWSKIPYPLGEGKHSQIAREEGRYRLRK